MELCTKSRGDIFLQDVNGGINYTRTLLTPLYVKDREVFYKLVGRNSIAPMDNYLGVDKLPFHMTYTMMARCATEAVKAKSFVCASNSLKEAGYQHISASMVDQVCETVGQALWDYYKERADIMQSRLARGEKIGPVNVDIHNIHSLNPEKVLILMIDGHTIYTRKYSTGKYDINDGGKCGCDCRVGIAFRLSDCSVEYDEAGGETVRISHKDYTSLIVPKNEFRNYFADLAIRNGADQCELIVVVSDGADWLHKMVVELFNSYVHIRDLWHAKECIAEFCKALFQDNPEKGILFSNYLCHLIEEGNIDKFINKLEKETNDHIKNMEQFNLSEKEKQDQYLKCIEQLDNIISLSQGLENCIELSEENLLSYLGAETFEEPIYSFLRDKEDKLNKSNIYMNINNKQEFSEKIYNNNISSNYIKNYVVNPYDKSIKLKELKIDDNSDIARIKQLLVNKDDKKQFVQDQISKVSLKNLSKEEFLYLFLYKMKKAIKNNEIELKTKTFKSKKLEDEFTIIDKKNENNEEVKEETLDTYNKFKSISIKNTNVNNVDFRELFPELHTLKLLSCQISYELYDYIKNDGFNNLTEIYLDGCNLVNENFSEIIYEIINKEVLRKNLKLLSAKNNKLNKLDFFQYVEDVKEKYSLENLEFLDFSYNRLYSFNNMILSASPKIKIVDISYNSFQSTGNWQSFMKHYSKNVRDLDEKEKKEPELAPGPNEIKEEKKNTEEKKVDEKKPDENKSIEGEKDKEKEENKENSEEVDNKKENESFQKSKSGKYNDISQVENEIANNLPEAKTFAVGQIEKLEEIKKEEKIGRAHV